MFCSFSSGLIVASSKDAVFGNVTPELVRALLKEHPQNVATLARKAVAKLVKASTVKGALKHGSHQPVLNSAALLSRLLPVLFEGEKEHHFVETVFWKGDLPSAAAPASSDGKQNAVPEVVPADSAKDPLAAPLMDAILALLFKPEFTCAGASDTAVWEGGMGGGAAGGKGSAYDAARAEMLKLLLVTCSETLYVTPGAPPCSRVAEPFTRPALSPDTSSLPPPAETHCAGGPAALTRSN